MCFYGTPGLRGVAPHGIRELRISSQARGPHHLLGISDKIGSSMMLVKSDNSCNIMVLFLTVLLMDELFTWSKLFRSLLVPKFEMFMLLTIGYRDDYPPPKPPDRATLLRTTGMELVEKWNDSFGVHYKQVRLGYEYLKKTLRLQFPNLRAAAALAEQQRQEKIAKHEG